MSSHIGTVVCVFREESVDCMMVLALSLNYCPLPLSSCRREQRIALYLIFLQCQNDWEKIGAVVRFSAYKAKFRFSVSALYDHPVSVWLLFCYSGFVQQSKEMHIRLKGNSSLSLCLFVWICPAIAGNIYSLNPRWLAQEPVPLRWVNIAEPRNDAGSPQV